MPVRDLSGFAQPTLTAEIDDLDPAVDAVFRPAWVEQLRLALADNL